jgi:hypothetical protein
MEAAMGAQTELEQLRAELAELKRQLKQQKQLEHPKSLPALPDNFEFVTDMTRFAEGLVSEATIRKKYHLLEEADWVKLGQDTALVDAIEAEKLRRVRDGSYKRERSQQLVTKAPDVLSGLLLNEKNSPKHRIDAAKTLDQFAGNGPQAAEEGERVIVTINLGNDVLRFGGPVRPTPNPSDDKIIDAVPGFMIPAKDGNDGGQPL